MAWGLQKCNEDIKHTDPRTSIEKKQAEKGQALETPFSYRKNNAATLPQTELYESKMLSFSLQMMKSSDAHRY
jgi:hypothetical protein